MADPVPGRDVARIRRVLARELDTISEYEQLAREAESPELRTFFLHLATEEKEHVAEATWLLGKLDPEQKNNYEKEFSDAHFGGTKPIAAVAPPQAGASRGYLSESHPLPEDPRDLLHALPAPPSQYAGRLSVGPLRGQKL